MSLLSDVTQLATDAALMHDIIHGGTTDTVVTEGGTVPSVAKAIEDFQNAIGTGQFANGTAAAPAISFVSDTDSGFYRVSANTIGISVNGVKIGEWSSTGINGCAIGATSASTGRFTTLSAAGQIQGTYASGGYGQGALKTTGSADYVALSIINTGVTWDISSIITSSPDRFVIRNSTTSANALVINSDAANEGVVLSSAGFAVNGTVSGANVVGTPAVHAISANAGVSATQITAEGYYNGYGAGMTMSSRTSAGGTLVPMAKIVADGTAAWNTTASTQDAELSIHTTTDGVLTRVGTWSTTALTLGSGVKLLPTTDNTQDIGAAATGFKEIFADNGTINTSDARRKTEVSALSAAEINAAKQLAKEIGSFKFLAAIAEKGAAARLHIGMTVQRAIEIMESNGLAPFAYSFICYDAWDQQVVEHPAVEAVAAQDAVLDEEGNVVTPAVEAVEAKDAWTEVTLEAGDKYSFRVHELLLFMAAGFEARLAALEAV